MGVDERAAVMNDISAAMLAIFDRLADGICLTSQGRVLYLNASAEKLLAITREQAIGTSLCERLCRHMSAGACADCAAHCVLRDPAGAEQAVTFDGRYSRRAFDWHELKIDRIDTARDMRVRCLRTPAWPDPDLPDVHLTILENVSAQAALEREREDWRSMIAHDLRSPLTGVYGVLRALQDEIAEASAKPSDPQLIDIGVRNCQRMIELVDLYLAVSKMESGQMGAEPAEVELSTLVARGVEEQSPLAKSRRIAVAFAVPSELKALADPLLLSRVVQNLLNNALKYTPEGGRVEISAAAEGPDRVQLAFVDDGPGISADELPRLFDRYHQAKARREGKILGTGLGLAFCRQALAAMGGDVRVESELGKGSRFLVGLPSAPRRGENPRASA